MKFVIDVREAIKEQKTGKGTWAFGFLQELLQRDVEVIPLSDRKVNLPNVMVLPSGMLWHAYAAKAVKSIPDVTAYISPTSYIVPAILAKKVPVIPIVHDLIAFQDGAHDRKARLIETLLLKHLTEHAAMIAVNSETTKRDLLNQYPSLPPKNVPVIYAGPLRAKRPLNISDQQTILCVGTLCPRKNQLRLIQAYAALPSSLRRQYTLLLAGARGWNDADIVDAAQQTDGVEWTGYIDNDTYDQLLSSAAVFALPSLYEGFGMQILDALQSGLPVLTSDRGSLQEVTGENAVLVDPENVESMSKGLEKLLTDDELQNRLRQNEPKQAEQFSWKKTVDLFLEAAEML